MKTLLLIDGNAIMHRAYFALPPLNSDQGIPTNAIYGFFMMLHKATTDFNPDYVIVCFDTPKPTFRQDLFKEYRAQRPKAADDFKVQIPYIRQLIDEAGITRLEKEGFEADDVIGTLARKYENQDTKVLILTGDKDILQLVDDRVTVISPKVGISSISLYTPDEVTAKMGVKPDQIPDYKALAGDPSDNYKGVKGIGPKTASRLIHKFDTVENLFKRLDEVEDGRLKALLDQNRENIVLMKTLATLVTDIDLPGTLDDCIFHGYDNKIQPTLHQLQLYSLQSRLTGTKKLVEAKKKPEKKDDSQIKLF